MGLVRRVGRGCRAVICCAALGLGLTGARAAAPPDVPRVIDEAKVPGAWRLVHSEMRMADGTTFPAPAYGSNPRGYLIYDKSHTMCVYLAPSEEPSRAPPSYQGPGVGPRQNGAIYCGRWKLNEARTAIVHQVELSGEKMLLGDQLRKAWIDGDTLTIRSTLPKGLTDYYLQFERVR